MIKKSFLLTASLILALTQPVLAGDRYQQRPPVLISPDLSAPWVMQLGGAARPVVYSPPSVRPSQGRSQRTLFPAAPRPAQAQPVAARPNKPARTQIDPRFLPQMVAYDGKEKPGTIVIDTEQRFLYLVTGNGQARRYGVGVGKPGFQWAGRHKITAKREWPSWTPPQEMISREAAKGHYLPARMDGGPENPLGARAMYLGSTLYRIHGTNAPWTIGYGVSSGCIRMRNQDVTDLYERVKVGTSVIVM
ncbi:L,D-transpeptidase [Agrobacterium sp. ES01]|uniref:L,D-transpeptidase n=1 Tax=Agrobacterium sp. ES01 TaxID=3420714 RepID=UPI003D14B0F3